VVRWSANGSRADTFLIPIQILPICYQGLTTKCQRDPLSLVSNLLLGHHPANSTSVFDQRTNHLCNCIVEYGELQDTGVIQYIWWALQETILPAQYYNAYFAKTYRLVNYFVMSALGRLLPHSYKGSS
jgi:hypothetical protein